MSAQPREKLSDLLPVKTAAELVPYSRDYITRLARNARVVAVQIDRQWFVERTSLLNFHAHSQIEESVRTRRLSQLRKSELEIRSARDARHEVIVKNLFDRRRHTLVQTALVLVCGIGTGVLMISTLNVVNQQTDSVTAALPHSDWFEPTAVIVGRSSDPVWFEETSVSESTEKIALGNGIVLLPPSATSSDVATDFFSDEVTVEMTGPVTGVIRNGVTEMSFVRVPQSTEANVLPTMVPNSDSP